MYHDAFIHTAKAVRSHYSMSDLSRTSFLKAKHKVPYLHTYTTKYISESVHLQ